MTQRSNTASSGKRSAPSRKKEAIGISGMQREKDIARLLNDPKFREVKKPGVAYVFVGYPMPPSATSGFAEESPEA
jgi:hypothetical protein